MAHANTTSPAHTAAPWHVKFRDSHIAIINDMGCDVARIEQWMIGSETNANARLIAAAPKLLERLQTLSEELRGMKDLMLSGTESDSWMVTEEGWNAIIDETDNVLAKAAGRS